MNEQLIKIIASELARQLTNRGAGRIFQLSRLSIAIDFRTGDNRYLFVSANPATDPRLYMIERRPRELENKRSMILRSPRCCANTSAARN
jgi:hypothetical protein